MQSPDETDVLLKCISDDVAKHAHRAILTAHERFAAGENLVEWRFGELTGAATMHPEGNHEDRAHVRTTHAEFAAAMAQAHANGALLGMRALIRHAEQQEEGEAQ